MFPEPTEFDRINLDPKIQIKYIDTKKPTCWHPNHRKFHTWWVESLVVLVQYQPFQFYSVLWYNGETISTRFRGKNESQQNRDQWWILLQGRRRTLSSSTSVSPEKRSYGSQDPWSAKAVKDDRERGNSLSTVTCTQHATHGGMMAKLGLLMSGKSDKSMDDRTGQPVVTSWRETHESQSSFFHEKTQHVIVKEKRSSW